MTGLIFADSPGVSPTHGALHKKEILQGPRQFQYDCPGFVV